MEKRTIGNQGLVSSILGLGCMGMTSVYGVTDEKESLRVIHRSLDLGVNILDTAEAYGPFLNERLIGKAIVGRQRSEVIIATKTGLEISDDGTFLAPNGSLKYIEKSVNRSLQNLTMDHIDLLYLHRLDPKTSIEETMGALSQLVKSGKVRYLGLSEVSASTIRRAHAIHPLSVVQSEYSLFERGVETNSVLDTLKELGIGFVAYSPLGRGFLSGTIKNPNDLTENDWRRTDPRFQGENFYRNLTVLDKVRRVASEKGITPSQLALAWVLYQGAVAIPGTKHVKFLEENIGASTITLSRKDLIAIESVAPRGMASGARYSDEAMSLIDQDDKDLKRRNQEVRAP